MDLTKCKTRLVLWWWFTSILLLSGCSPRKDVSPSNQRPYGVNISAPSGNSPITGSAVARDGKLTASPNPIQVCDGAQLGITTLTYSFLTPVTIVEVRVGSPAGVQLTHSESGGVAKTGKWVNDGEIFYLQDVSDGKSLTPDNTLATVTVNITSAGCP